MIQEYFDIKDSCRKGLIKYLEKALSKIGLIDNPHILDVGCGSGVPTLFILENIKCKITAIDSNENSINILKSKIKNLNQLDKIKVLYGSIFEIKNTNNEFDLIIAEGILNVVGFEKGFLKFLELLKNHGFMIIHDELRNHNSKLEFIENNNCKLLASFILDEKIWWNCYYKCLEEQINKNSNRKLLNLFKSDLSEIELIKQNPSQFKSIYYIIEKNK